MELLYLGCYYTTPSDNLFYNMKNLVKCVLVVLMVFYFGCQTQVESGSNNNLEGLWTLQMMELYDPATNDYAEWRGGMQGYILYDSQGHMALNLATKDYQNFELAFPNFTDTIAIEALRHLTNNYFYMANYKVLEDEGIVEHARIIHSNPGEWNDVVRRRFAFNGDTLIISPVEERNKGLRLKWIRTKTE